MASYSQALGSRIALLPLYYTGQDGHKPPHTRGGHMDTTSRWEEHQKLAAVF